MLATTALFFLNLHALIILQAVASSQVAENLVSCDDCRVDTQHSLHLILSWVTLRQIQIISKQWVVICFKGKAPPLLLCQIFDFRCISVL